MKERNRPGSLWRSSSSSVAFEENELLDAWPLDVRRSGCKCDTPGSSSKPSSSSHLYRTGPLLRNSRCPKPVQKSGLGTGTRLSYSHSSKTAFWGKKFSPAYYYAFETDCHVVKRYIFHLHKARRFTDSSISKHQTAVEISPRNGVYQRDVSLSA